MFYMCVYKGTSVSLWKIELKDVYFWYSFFFPFGNPCSFSVLKTVICIDLKIFCTKVKQLLNSIFLEHLKYLSIYYLLFIFSH